MNQIWSVAGDEERADVNQMYLQPFLTYNWKSAAGLTVNAEADTKLGSRYDKCIH